MANIFISQNQWYALNKKYVPKVTQETRDGRDRFRHWRCIRNKRVIFNVTELIWSDKDTEWLFVGDDSVLIKLRTNPTALPDHQD